MNDFSGTLNEVMDNNNIDSNDEMTTDQRVSHTPMFATLDPDLDDFEVTHASQDDVDYEQEELGTTIENDWFDEDDEETTDMKQLSPAFREIFNEYPEDEEDDDDDA